MAPPAASLACACCGKEPEAGRKWPSCELCYRRDLPTTSYCSEACQATHWKGGHKAIALQGNMSQNARDKAMQGFRDGQYQILVATDIVARGIDVQGVAYVINYDVPMTAEAYTHRIGRTGRAELAGQALSFLTPADKRWLKAVQKMLGAEIRRHKEKGFDSGYNERNAPQQVVAGAFGKKKDTKAGPPRKKRGPEPGRKRGSRRGAARSGESPGGGGGRRPGRKPAGKRGGRPRSR